MPRPCRGAKPGTSSCGGVFNLRGTFSYSALYLSVRGSKTAYQRKAGSNFTAGAPKIRVFHNINRVFNIVFGFQHRIFPRLCGNPAVFPFLHQSLHSVRRKTFLPFSAPLSHFSHFSTVSTPLLLLLNSYLVNSAFFLFFPGPRSGAAVESFLPRFFSKKRETNKERL